MKCGDNYTLLQTNNKNIYGIGDNSYYQLSLTNTDKCDNITYINTLKDIKIDQYIAVKYTSIFVDNNGYIYTCGKNLYGLNAINNSNNISQYLTKINQFFSDKNVKIKNIKNGILYVCAITDNNNIYFWGHNYHGQCGIGDEIENVFKPTQFIFNEMNQFKNVYLNHASTIVMDFDNNFIIFGANRFSNQNY